MRFIPKNSKVKFTFSHGITVPDVIVGAVGLLLIVLSISSNLEWKWWLALSLLVLFIPLFITIDDTRLYAFLGRMLKYLFSKKEYKGDSVSAVIPYREIKDGTIISGDGGRTAVIEIQTIGMSMLSEDAQNQIIDGCLTNVLNLALAGQCWLLTKIEQPLMMDDHIEEEEIRADKLCERAEEGKMSDIEVGARVSIIEDRMGMASSLSEDGGKYARFYLSLVGVDSRQVMEQAQRASYILSSGGITNHVLSNKELLTFIRYSNHEDFDEREDVPIQEYGKHILPPSVRFKTGNMTQGGETITHFVINRYPSEVGNCWASALFAIPNTKVVMRMTAVEKGKALRRLDNSILEVQEKQGKGKTSAQMQQDTHVDSLMELLADLQSDTQKLFDTEIIISVYDEPGTAINAKNTKQALREMGIGFSPMFANQQECYTSSFSSKTNEVKITRGIQSSSLSASCPFEGDVLNDKNGLLLGETSLPAFVDFFKRDSTHVNSNMVVIGQSGSGKSFATKTVLSALATTGAKVYVLDPENEYGELARNLDGVNLDVSSGRWGKINPFQITSVLDDDDGTNGLSIHLQFVEQFFKVALPGISQDALELLDRITREAYERKGIDSFTDLSHLTPGDYPTFQDLIDIIRQRMEIEKEAYTLGNLRVVDNYLAKFGEGEMYADLWNGATTFSAQSNFVAFDFQRLLANRNQTTANAQMLLILKWLDEEIIKNRDENLKTGRHDKVVVAIDEAHLFIDEKFPVALDFMYQLAKRIRKYDGMLIMVTQNVKDFMGTPEIAKKSQGIINVSQYSMIFQLAPNDMNDLAELYRSAGGLNEAERQDIVHAPRGNAFFITSSSHRTRLSVWASPKTVEMFS